MTDDDAALFAALEEDFADVSVDGVQDVKALETADLLRLFHAVERRLRVEGEMVNPKTQLARDLHSRRGAYIVEMRRRKLR